MRLGGPRKECLTNRAKISEYLLLRVPVLYNFGGAVCNCVQQRYASTIFLGGKSLHLIFFDGLFPLLLFFSHCCCTCLLERQGKNQGVLQCCASWALFLFHSTTLFSARVLFVTSFIGQNNACLTISLPSCPRALLLYSFQKASIFLQCFYFWALCVWSNVQTHCS